MNAPPASDPLANVEALISAGRYPEADRACDAILSRQPGDPGARYFRAMLRVHAARVGEGRELLEALVREHPQFVAARYLLADAYRREGRFLEAAEGYASALAQEFSLAAAHDLASRLEAIIDFIAHAPLDRWWNRGSAIQAFGASLEKSGQDIGAAGLLERLADSPLPLAGDGTFPSRLASACAALGVGRDASPAWMRPIVEGVLVPWMRRSIAADLPGNALDIENLVYGTYVVTTENQEHFRECFALWQDDMRAAGRRFAAALPALERRASASVPRIAFFVHNVTMLAHATALLEVLEGHAELAQPAMEPYLFYQSGDPATIDRFRKAGLRVEQLTGPATSSRTASALIHLRQRIAEEGIDVLAWISLAVMMPFAFAMRLAPRQVWWAMKYHALEFAEIDDYLTGGGETGIHEIRGRPWRVGPVVAGKWFAPEFGPEAERIRRALGAKGLVFGSFGRSEKLNSPAFLDAVVEILRAQPDAMFLWTGRSQLPSIQQHLERGGVARRCRFIGWVNTKLYAQVIDVFLDSFPFPGGFTLYEAMAAGKAAVLFASPESAHGGINAIVGPLLASNPSASEEAALAHAIFQPEAATPLYLRAPDPARYIEYALRLARDDALRERVGQAGREFIEKVMTDRRRAAHIYVDHLLGRNPAPATG